MSDDAYYARDLLRDVADMRAHARAARAGDGGAATLAALLSAGGAAVFLASTQITTAGCEVTGAARCCSGETVEFNGWAYWVIGGAVGAVLVALIRRLRGVRRASPLRLAARPVVFVVVAAVAALFAGYSVGK